MTIKTVASNRKASFDYFILDRLEAGIVLTGSEIKSIRSGQMSIKEAYVHIDEKGEVWLVEAHISPYDPASRMNHEPKRARKLLLHHKEISKLRVEIRQKGLTIVPLQVYLKDGRAKIEIAIAKGKKQYDKRAAIASRETEREVRSEFKMR